MAQKKKTKTKPYEKQEVDWTKFSGHEETVSLIMRRRRQFLVHSFLYYVLDSSIISDEMYDRICNELVELQKKYPKMCKMLPYEELCSQLDETASGSFIEKTKYPLEIVAKSFQLLSENWTELAQRKGYQIVRTNVK